MFVTAVESYQHIRYRVYYNTLCYINKFLKMCINCLVSGKYIRHLFMSQVEISTNYSVNKRSNVI